MSKKVTNFMIVNIVNFLNSIADKKLPQKISYAITRNIMTFSKEYEIYSKSLIKIYESYKGFAVEDENGNIMRNDMDIPVLSDEEKQKQMNIEISELLNIEIDIDIYTISSDLFDYDDADGRYDSLSATEIMNLQSILCDNSKEDRKE